jgi:hypothetical protein
VLAAASGWTERHGGVGAWADLFRRSRARFAGGVASQEAPALVDSYLAPRLPSAPSTTRSKRAWRAVALAVVGLVALFRPTALTKVVVIVVGLAALYLALTEAVAVFRHPARREDALS